MQRQTSNIEFPLKVKGYKEKETNIKSYASITQLSYCHIVKFAMRVVVCINSSIQGKPQNKLIEDWITVLAFQNPFAVA